MSEIEEPAGEDAGAGKEYYRWNVDPAWHHHVAMTQEAQLAFEAPSEFSRYYHSRLCLFGAVGLVETSLNKIMRARMEGEGSTEREILKKLKEVPLGLKLERWLPSFFDKPIDVPDAVASTLRLTIEMRNEITHPKQRDHSIYKALDGLSPVATADLVSQFIADIQVREYGEYGYWLLGWNYVGSVSNPWEVSWSNSHQVYWAMLYFGFRFPVGYDDRRFVREHFKSVEGFLKLRDILGKEGVPAIEPFDAQFPIRPRLTRRWWDPAVVLRDRPLV